MSFMSIAARLRRLVEQRALYSDDRACDEIGVLITESMLLYGEHVKRGRSGFNSELMPAPIEGLHRYDVRELHKCWRERVVPNLQIRFGTRVPPDPLVTAEVDSELAHDESRTSKRNPRAAVLNKQPWPTHLWPRRAENYAILMELLAELAKELPPKPPIEGGKGNRGGSTPKYDAKEDARLASSYKASGLSVKDYALKQNLPLERVKRAIDRHRKRNASRN